MVTDVNDNDPKFIKKKFQVDMKNILVECKIVCEVNHMFLRTAIRQVYSSLRHLER
jgi:hypothetical protein